MNNDPIAQMNTYRSFVSLLVDPSAKDENKLKAAQELSEDLETIVASPQYPAFLEHAIKVFLKILSETEPQFVAEHNGQQLRKLILEIIHRLPVNDHLRPHVKLILSLMFQLLEVDNEENVLVCLRIIIELHKQYRPPFTPESVKQIYKELPTNLNKIFEPRMPYKIKDLSEVNINLLLSEIFTQTSIQLEKKNADGSVITYNVIPRATVSLKVLAELPIIVVLMYQLYKVNVHQEVEGFIPLIMITITLQPSQQHRMSPAFNKEVFVDFMAAQIKTLSFLAYIVKLYQEAVNAQSAKLTQGMLGLLMYCPPEVAHLRKELLIAARHILATDLRTKFVTCIEQLFDGNILIGNGWTAHESLRPLAYSTVADLVHHVRQMLPLKDLAAAVNLFSKNVHDESLPTSIQTMSCKLLLNLVECLRSKAENNNSRELLMRMLEVFVLKFKSVAKLQLPALMQKQNSTANQSQCNQSPDGVGELFVKEDKPKFGFPPSPSVNYTVADCRSLVKTLVCGVKTITWGIPSCKPDSAGMAKQFTPKETIVFIRLVKYAMQALDIYTLTGGTTSGATPTNTNQQQSGPAISRQPVMQTVRSKEEKEVLEHFAGVFHTLSPQTFREIFSTLSDFVVERINANYALQIVANSFLAHPPTSPVFATILVEYLLERMEEMGSNVEKSNLYLKLFKLVFGSVSLLADKNEQMLKPHLHNIVNRSMELALSAKEPYNYFLLLRALFRSIGGGSHDLLYQEFLPLLPSLLQGLNSLQSGLHKQHMKDLFVELCLTVPVRLSSLLPYLPMLMDPLVSALNGSQTLVSQGLRTLELCVDNLQPDFLYDHIQPVRAELMQALWKTLRNPSDNTAQVAFRVLGKFGGGNRKMMTEPQKFEYSENKEGFQSGSTSIVVMFPDHRSPILLPVDKVVETAFTALKSSSTDPFYRKQCWEVLKGFLIAHIQQPGQGEDEKYKLQQFFCHPSFTQSDINPVQGPFYKSNDVEIRKVHEMALTGMFVAAAIKDLRDMVLPFMVSLVRHYTLIAISQQSGPINLGGRQHKLQGMDPLVLIDAVASIMGHEEKELCKPGHLALIIILDTATAVLGSKERACHLPLTEYLVERMCSLCYDRAWYAKYGGCIAIKFLFERMTLKWVFNHQYLFLKALLFVMLDLTGEVSSGAVDLAKSNLEKMLTLCGQPIRPNIDGSNKDLIDAQKKSLHEVTQELVRQVTSPNTCVRQQAMHSLQVLARVQSKSVTEIMEPHKEVLADMVPPKKHLLRHQPVNAQIGLMDGNTFCTTLDPRLFTIDVNIHEHKTFLQELYGLCDADDSVLLKLPCYKNVTNLVPLRKSAYKALASCYYITQWKDRISSVLFKALSSPIAEIQETGFECMKKFVSNTQMDIEAVNQAVRPFIQQLNDYRNLNLNTIQRLSYLSQLFPNCFIEKICDQLLQHLRKLLDTVIVTMRAGQKCVDEMKIPAASAKYVEQLLSLVFKTEKAILVEPGSVFRAPLRRFLQRYPDHTLDLLLTERNVNEDQIYRFVKYLLKGEEGRIFRRILEQNPQRLIKMASGVIQIQEKVSVPQPQPPPVQQPDGSASPVPTVSPTHQTKNVTVTYDLQYQAILITSILVKHEEQWLATQSQLVEILKSIWVSDEFANKHSKVETVDFVQWKEPKLLVRCLLNYFKQNPSDIVLLFNLLRAFMGRFICDFDFFRDFLENTVVSFSIEWKRAAFFKFVEVFHDTNYNQDLKAKILQYIIIPAFAVSFERGEGERLIGGPPAPELDLPDNLISVFINRVIDPDNPFGNSDAVRILLLQFSCLLVEQASPHIHDAANKRQGIKLRRLMTFAWPCLLTKNCVDPATKYHGHLLLAHIIAKFAIHKRIVLQVFHSLLKAYAVEARLVVRQALEILTPAMPQRMEDGNTMLTHWTKKIIIEEGHTLAQLVHMLQLLVRHYKVYYPVRHHLIQHMVTSVQRLGFTPNASVEHKKIAVDLAEVIIRWELQRIREEQEQNSNPNQQTNVQMASGSEPGTSVQRVKLPPMTSASTSTLGKPLTTDNNKPVDKAHADAVVYFLLRMACHVNESGSTSGPGSPGELLSRRCVALLKTALKPEIWPNAELRLAWFDKLLLTVESQSPNYGNICTALELLCFLLTILRKEQILSSFKPLQKGIAACMNCSNSKVIRCVHNLLSRLMTQFPTEPTTSNVTSKYEELESLYTSVSKVIYEGLNNYEKATNSSPQALFSTLMILKAACMNNPCYIDRLITSFMRVLQKMQRDHLNPPQNAQEASTPMSTELLILSLDLVKNRIGVMGQEMRKSFFGTILVGLIEKSPDVKVLKAITKMVEDWVKNKGPFGVNQAPTLREKTCLLVKMMLCIEKRFPDDLELTGQFLELINYVFRDESLKNTDLPTRLEQAFMAGLRCVQPQIRAKFFEVFNSSIRARLHDRLMYIVCSQNWEHIGPHFWIKQCIELLLVTAVTTLSIQSGNTAALLPSPTAVISLGDQQERASFANTVSEQMDVDVLSSGFNGLENVRETDEEIDIELSSNDEGQSSGRSASIDGSNIYLGNGRRPSTPSDPTQQLRILLTKQNKFLDSLRETKTIHFLMAVSQLCHMDTNLAHQMWINLFPRLWKILSDRQQNSLASEIVPFICSGSHVIQKDCQPSAIGTFMEAIAHCSPPISIRPCLLKYIGKAHNLWHRSALMLENIAFDKSANANAVTSVSKQTRAHSSASEFDGNESLPVPPPSPLQEAIDSLAEIYETLKEEDLCAGLWQKRAKYQETLLGLAYEQQGFFEQAQAEYELAMSKARNDTNPAPISLQSEYRLWEKHWIRCSKELNQWDLLLEFGNSKGCANPFLILESAWRVPNWNLMKDALYQVETNCPKEFAWKVALYKGYNHICNQDEHNLTIVDKMVEYASNLCIKEWRRLPPIVSHIHISLLQAAQQIMELQEAGQIHQSFLPSSVGRTTNLHDMKAIVKTWRNRLPVLADDLSHWSDIFTWRQHHYQAIVNHYESSSAQTTTQIPSISPQTDQQTSHAMLGVHASAQSIIHYGKIARKHGLIGVCLDSLNRIHTIPSVPIVDCFQKIRQQVKCYLHLSMTMGKNELQEGLEVIESTNLKYFTKEMTAEFYALKGMFLAQIGRSEEANKAFSAAAQLHDTLVKAWALWGDYLETMFTRDRWDNRNMSLGVSALTCYLHACRHQNESKSRKYLAKYNVGVPPVCWLPFIPQLLTCLVRKEGKIVLNILTQVGRVFPQAVYFPIRTLYLTLKMEQREKYKSGELQQQQQPVPQQQPTHSVGIIASSTTTSVSSTLTTNITNMPPTRPIRATPPMWRCSRIMHCQRDLHPTVLSSLEGIVDQMVWFRENWYEEVLRQLKQGLTKCYAVAFENRANVADCEITQSTLSFVKKLVSTFGVGIENVSPVSTNFATAASESLAKRAQATAQDPVFQKMKGQFTADFDFNSPGSMKLHNVINKLKKWIKILEAKTKLLPKSLLIEEKCKFLSNFSQQTADVELPGEFLLPKHNHYYVRIARFMPRVEIVNKHNTAARRLYIRGHNGKIYPYLVVNDSCLTDARREERVLQLLRLLNHYLGKQKETSKRFLNFTVPRVVAISPQMRLVEDNPSSISLLDIYKQKCIRRNIEHDASIARYYERLASVQARGSQASHQVLREILKEIQGNMVPITLLKEWAIQAFPEATSLWSFRKQFTLQLALANLAEFVLHLTRLNPDMLYIHQDSGLMNFAYFKFDVDDHSGELDANRPVPFRLTHCISEFITGMGVSGPLTASMIATARCLVQPNFKVQSILRAILRDEILAWYKKTQGDSTNASGEVVMKGELLINMVNKAVTAIMTRLQNLATFDGAESKVTTLVAAANSHDNLCRMDPAWHPWL
ncbi:transformation/transcription domain-associated protein-like protein [Dinothrombium tinctorium]|uniref:Transformation/transcription domain-associated protein-like protein n=1 Tax=Dinothrombium tinctorium TaxID=1965070 RepID=A0A3S3SK12_9ACAR|nr:transformation/transcription domain-associated protein-like protein [Dinothrombium tinctorium]